jgi:hypothetical protein
LEVVDGRLGLKVQLLEVVDGCRGLMDQLWEDENDVWGLMDQLLEDENDVRGLTDQPSAGGDAVLLRRLRERVKESNDGNIFSAWGSLRNNHRPVTATSS